MSQDTYESISTKKLKKLILHTEKTLSELHEELDKRTLDQQHSEIDHLEEHMEEMENRFDNFMAFLKEVINKK